MELLTSEIIPQACRDWRGLTAHKAAKVFQAAFAEASILPNLVVVDAARRQSDMILGDVVIALAGSDRFWSAYLAGTAWLAVEVEQGETFHLTELAPDVLATLLIPISKEDHSP